MMNLRTLVESANKAAQGGDFSEVVKKIVETHEKQPVKPRKRIWE